MGLIKIKSSKIEGRLKWPSTRVFVIFELLKSFNWRSSTPPFKRL